MRAKYGAAMAARVNPAVEQWFITREAEQAKRRASELVINAVQQPEPAELETRQAVSELQTAREVEVLNRERDLLVADKRNLVEEAYLPPQAAAGGGQSQYVQGNDDAIAA